MQFFVSVETSRMLDIGFTFFGASSSAGRANFCEVYLYSSVTLQ